MQLLKSVTVKEEIEDMSDPEPSRIKHKDTDGTNRLVSFLSSTLLTSDVHLNFSMSHFLTISNFSIRPDESDRAKTRTE